MRRLGRLLSVAGLAIAVSGCWPMPGQNADRTGHNSFEDSISPGAVLRGFEERWTWTLPGAGPIGDPVVSSAGVHAPVVPCWVATVAADTGEARWTAPTLPDPEVVCSQGTFDPATLDVFVVDDAVYVGASLSGLAPRGSFCNGFTNAFDIASGEMISRLSTGAVDSVRGTEGVGVDCAVLDSGPAWWATGGEVGAEWPELDIRTDVTGETTLGKEHLYTTGFGLLASEPGDPSEGQGVRAYSRDQARPGCGDPDDTEQCPLWATPTDAKTVGPVVIGENGATLYVGTEAGTIYALDAATGAVRWTAPTGSAVSATPALANGRLFVTTENGVIFGFDAAGCGSDVCHAMWEGDTGSAVRVQPAVAGGVLFTGSSGGRLDLWDADPVCRSGICEPLRSISTGSPVTGAPAVSNGQVYIGVSDGRLIAYGLSQE